jgi:serine/threonine-protein kinase
MEALSPGRRLADRYVLEAPIADGGMASVWRARDEVLARTVAVKVLRADLARDPVVAERFHREAVAAARLSHPAIVAVYDTGVDDGAAYLVMELAGGRTLADVIAERAPLPSDRAIAYLVPVLSALEYAHAHGIVHRDVKPGNVLVDADGRVRVTDFGIAKAAFENGQLTDSGEIIGTVRYVAPEQVQGGPIDGRTDLYAVGVILYELLTGRPPFEAETPVAAAMVRLARDPVRPRDLRPQIGRQLEGVTLKALSREPDGRFADAAQFRAALERLGAGDATTGSFAPIAADTGPLPAVVEDEPGSSWFRAWMLVPLVMVVVAAGLIAVGLAFGRIQLGGPLGLRPAEQPSSSPASASPLRSIRIVTATDVDPEGDPPSENPQEVPAAIDGSDATAWSTQHYSTAGFGGLKDGLGLFVAFRGEQAIARVTIRSTIAGWTFELIPGASADPAGTPARSLRGKTTFRVGTDGRAVVDLREVPASGLLVWITGLAPDQGGYAASIAAISVEGPG